MIIKPRQRFRPERTGVTAPLGELEAAIMRVLWSEPTTGCLAAEVQAALPAEQPAALTTILTTLDRLLTKGIVCREREGKAYRFRALFTQDELERRIVTGVLNSLIARFPTAVATYFAEAGGNTAALEELARQLKWMQDKQSESLETLDG